MSLFLLSLSLSLSLSLFTTSVQSRLYIINLPKGNFALSSSAQLERTCPELEAWSTQNTVWVCVSLHNSVISPEDLEKAGVGPYYSQNLKLKCVSDNLGVTWNLFLLFALTNLWILSFTLAGIVSHFLPLMGF